MTLKTEYATSHFKPWKEIVLAKVKEKITEPKQKIKPKQTKPVLSNQDVKKHLEKLYRKFLLLPLIKHEIILNLYVENATFPNYW